MGVALCHRVPRDGVLLLSMLLVLAACVLQAIVIGHHASITHVAHLTDASGRVLAYIAAHPALYAPLTMTAAAADEKTMTTATLRKVCDPSDATLLRACARFAEAYHAVNGLVVAAFVTAVLTLLCGLFVFTALSRTTTGLLRRLLLIVSVPATLQCAAVGVFFAQVVPHAKAVMQAHFATARSGDVVVTVAGAVPAMTVSRSYVANMAIAALPLLCAAVLLAAARLCRALYASYAPTPLYLVNDDWQRQKHVLRTHARSVQLELRISEQRPGDTSGSGSAETSHSNVKPMYSSDSSSQHASSYAQTQQQQQQQQHDAHEHDEQQQQQQQQSSYAHGRHAHSDTATAMDSHATTAVHGFAFRQCANASITTTTSVPYTIVAPTTAAAPATVAAAPLGSGASSSKSNMSSSGGDGDKKTRTTRAAAAATASEPIRNGNKRNEGSGTRDAAAL